MFTSKYKHSCPVIVRVPWEYGLKRILEITFSEFSLVCQTLAVNPAEYYIIPSHVMAKNISKGHGIWLEMLGKKGQKHNDNPLRAVHIPPHKSLSGRNIGEYRDRWDLLEQKLKSQNMFWRAF